MKKIDADTSHIKIKKIGFFKRLRDEYRRNRSTFILYIILRIAVIIVGVRQLFIGNYENTFLCVFTLVLMLVPAFVEQKFHVELPTPLENIVLLFIFAAEILGEINNYYIIFPLWDTILHTVTGFLAAGIGLSLIDILNRNEKIKFNLSPIFAALVSFCFSMTIGVLWEFFEFYSDIFLMTDMQKDTILDSISSVALNPEGVNVAVKITNITDTLVNGVSLNVGGYLDIGLYDTMKDMFVNFIGAVAFSVFGFFYIKYRGKNLSASVVDSLTIKRRND